ncbi:unnamed protein product [Prorocentrum cordatum]|uniref:Uncharacterized protein n=1 Tax=Prorocentrum cordatum TaxID=2364126 RepID=A0ABN9RP95_9DINO|nr:unnamed protein product [Polarella glacialis]CAK0885067.1 unnamed protein product [Polarella glacialis]
MSGGRAMAPGAGATLAVSAAVGAPAARAALRLAGGLLAAVVAASTTCPAFACHQPAWAPTPPHPPPPPPALGAEAAAAAVVEGLAPRLANAPPAPATCPSAEAVALLERPPPAGPAGAPGAEPPSEAGPALTPETSPGVVLAWGLAVSELASWWAAAALRPPVAMLVGQSCGRTAQAPR